jgi:glycoprotein 3-alpha-L-fucosyltransferase
MNEWIVPIVLKGSIYRQIAPPNSYIAVDSFKTMKEFIDYLQYLKQNTTAYIEYFRWRQDYEFGDVPSLCQLCTKLWDTNESVKVWNNISEWYAGDKVCQANFAANLHKS